MKTQVLLLAESETGQSPEHILEHFQYENCAPDFRIDSVIQILHYDPEELKKHFPKMHKCALSGLIEEAKRIP